VEFLAPVEVKRPLGRIRIDLMAFGDPWDYFGRRILIAKEFTIQVKFMGERGDICEDMRV
jgi:hypothetical protein